MFENSNMWISGLAAEDIKNNSICVYHGNDRTLTNIRNRDEIVTEVFVFVDQPEIYINGEVIVPDVVQKGKYARCLRVHIIA